MRPVLLASLFPPPLSAAEAAADAADVDAPGSDIDAFGRNVAARGDDSYKSCKSVRPSATTGAVA